MYYTVVFTAEPVVDLSVLETQLTRLTLFTYSASDINNDSLIFDVVPTTPVVPFDIDSSGTSTHTHTQTQHPPTHKPIYTYALKFVFAHVYMCSYFCVLTFTYLFSQLVFWTLSMTQG